MRTITPYEAIKSHVDKFKNSLNTVIPAEIVAVNLEEDYITSVDVDIVNFQFYKSDKVKIKRPTIYNVPLLFPSSSAGTVSYPVKVGDSVLLLFCQEDIDNFLQGNPAGVPNTFRKFSLTDAVALPCFQKSASGVKAHKDDFQITFNDFRLSVTPSGELSIKTNRTVNVEAESCSESYTEDLTVTAERVSIGNSSVNIVQYLTDLTDEISKTTVGGVPLDNKAAFEALKAQIETLL